MSQQSSIEWTDATWNPVRGCAKVSPGCAHCYAETFAERFRGVKGHPYEQGFDLRLAPEKLDDPLRWKKPRRVFVNSMSDLFQDGVPWSFVEQVFDVMQQTPQHTYQVLTKRAGGMRLFAEWWAFHHDCTLPNVLLGVSIENKRMATERFPEVVALGHRGWRTMVSMEPLLERVDVPREYLALGNRAWVIVGGESGPGARPFDTLWAQGLVYQCQDASVPVFVKQMGSNPLKDGTRVKLLSAKGGHMAEWPEDLRVREFPS